MALTTLEQLELAHPGQRLAYYKTNRTWTGGGAASVGSSWGAGGYPPAGAAPGTTAVVPTKDTVGALPFVVAGGTNVLYIARRVHMMGSKGGGFWADRLYHVSGFNATLTTLQSVVGSAAVNRPDTTGENVLMYLEVYTAVGTTAVTATVTYTNQAGTTGRTGTATFGGSTINYVGAMIPVALQAGDTGVRSVQSVQLSATTGVAGDFGVTLLRFLWSVEASMERMNYRWDWISSLLQNIDPNACIFSALASSTNTGNNEPKGTVWLVEG